MLRVYSPFPVEAIPRIGFWFERIMKRVADDYGPQNVTDMVQAISQQIENGVETWAVERDGELGGFISIQRRTPILAEVNCIFKPEFFCRPTADDAIRRVFRQVFDSGILKITGNIFKDNLGVKDLGVRVGLKREGLLKKHTMRDGKLVDVMVLGITKEEFNLCSDQ